MDTNKTFDGNIFLFLELILEKVNLVKQLRAHLDFTLKLNKKISVGISTVKKNLLYRIFAP